MSRLITYVTTDGASEPDWCQDVTELAPWDWLARQGLRFCNRKSYFIVNVLELSDAGEAVLGKRDGSGEESCDNG